MKVLAVGYAILLLGYVGELRGSHEWGLTVVAIGSGVLAVGYALKRFGRVPSKRVGPGTHRRHRGRAEKRLTNLRRLLANGRIDRREYEWCRADVLEHVSLVSLDVLLEQGLIDTREYNWYRRVHLVGRTRD